MIMILLNSGINNITEHTMTDKRSSIKIEKHIWNILFTSSRVINT